MAYQVPRTVQYEKVLYGPYICMQVHINSTINSTTGMNSIQTPPTRHEHVDVRIYSTVVGTAAVDLRTHYHVLLLYSI